MALLALTLATTAIVDIAADNRMRQKARYYYLEGVRHQASDDNASAYEYFKKATQIDPTYSEAASAFGTLRLIADSDTLQSLNELKHSMALMRDFVDTYPQDYYESQYYAYIAGNLDETSEAVRVFERTDSLRPDKPVSLLYLAESYAKLGDLKKAITALDRYERREGPAVQLTMKKTQLYLGLRDTLGAFAEIDRLIESNPHEPGYLLLKGGVHEMLQQPDSALKMYEQAEALAPDNGRTKLALANFYRGRGDSLAYDAKMYDALLSEDFDVAEKTRMLAEYLQSLFYDKSDHKRGDRLFDVVREQYPHEPDIIDLDAAYSAAKGDFKTAAERMAYAIDLSPATESYYLRRMQYLIQDERYDEAMATYERAGRHVKIPSEMKYNFALAAILDKQTDKAIEMYGEMLGDILPGITLSDSICDPALRNSLSYEDLMRVSDLFTITGDQYYADKRLDEAYRCYDNALFFYNGNALALNNYAYFLAVNDGDLDKAFDMSEKAVALQPDNDTYLDTYAWILFKRGDYSLAREYQKRAIEIAEGVNDVKGDDADDGEAELVKAVEEVEPANAELYEHYGDILYFNQESEEALEYWKKALTLEPDNEILKRKVKEKRYINP